MKLTWLIAVGAIVADQILKALVIAGNLPHYAGRFYSLWLALGVLGGLLIAVRKGSSLGLVLVVSGGLSNCLDLILRNAVVDIFVLKNFVFNLADVEIALGACLSAWEVGKNYFKATQRG